MDQPSPLLVLLADELRRARTAAGMTQDAVAREISYSASLVAAVEQARRVPRPEFTRRCDELLKTDGLLTRIREKMRHEPLLDWFREWARIEEEATLLRWYEPLVVPGLLQTEAYARALHEGASPLTGEEMEQQVAARMERQRVLHRDKPPRLVAALDEYVLRRAVGGPAVMRAQLEHLVEMGRPHHVFLHVVPAGAGAYRGLNGPLVLASAPDAEDVAYLDNQIHGHVVEDPAHVQSIQQTWESVLADALPHRQSIDLIAEAARTWS